MAATKAKSLAAGRRPLALVIGAGVAAVAAAGLGVAWLSGGAGTQSAAQTFQVVRGPLTISVTESGTITAKDQIIVKSQVEGRATIIFLVEEGQYVNEGDLLVELDSSGLQTDLIEQQIKVQNAEAAQVQAQEALAAAKLQAQADISQAELDHEFAKQDLVQYLEGTYPTDKQTAESEITLKEEELTQAKQTLDWSERLFKEDYLSKNELEKDRLAFNRAEIDLELAKRNMQVLEEYTKPRQIATYESAIEQTKLALEKTRRSSSAEIVKAEADELAKRAELENQRAKLAKLLDQIAKCKMIAPTSGMVVYATTGKGGWRPEEPLREGQEVRERQELIYLPTASTKTAEVKIHESALEKVALGMPVRITVDALPGKDFRGKVVKISPLPDAQSVWMNPDLKVYNTTIELEGNVDEIRTGMTCRAEVLIDHYREATYLPVQAVVRVGNQPTVYVRRGEGFEARAVQLGLSNNRMVRVMEGVEAGELVSLTPPLAPAAREDDTVAAAAGFSPGDVQSARTSQEAAALQTSAAAAAMSTEQREALQKQLESMTPEQRQAMRNQFGSTDAAAVPGATPPAASTQTQ